MRTSGRPGSNGSADLGPDVLLEKTEGHAAGPGQNGHALPLSIHSLPWLAALHVASNVDLLRSRSALTLSPSRRVGTQYSPSLPSLLSLLYHVQQARASESDYAAMFLEAA